MSLFAQKKVLVFGALGAAGCLFGWILGEGLLAAASPRGETQAPSLASRLETLPPAPAPVVVASPTVPPPPAAPVASLHPPLTPVAATGPVFVKREPAPPLPADILERLKKAGGKSGDIQITLIWNNRNDLDLHCIDPNNDEIFYQRKKAEKSGGTLDVDRNAAASNAVNDPIENIFFPTALPGRYQVYVNHYSKRDTDPTAFTVNIKIESERKSFEGKISSGEKKQLVHEFIVAGLRMASSPQVVVNQGGANKFRVLVERNALNKDPIQLTFGDGGEGLTLPAEVTIPPDKDEIEVDVSAALKAAIGERKVRIIAEGKFGKAETETKVVIQTGAGLGVSLPPEVVLYPGGKNKFQINLERLQNPNAVDVYVEGESAGLKLPAKVSVLGNSTELEVSAAVSATAGTRKVRVVVEGAHGKIEAECRFVVQIPPAVLRLAASPTVSVRPGETNRIPVRIAREWFDAPVLVRAAANGVSITEFTIPAGQTEGELVIAAPPDATGSTVPVKLTASSGTTEATANLTAEIQPPPPPPPAVTPAPTWSWRLVVVIGFWTAFLAVGLCLALAIGQNRYLSRPWLSGRQAAVLVAGGGLAGLIAGGIGQMLFGLMASGGVMPEIGFLAGWLLLGGLLGRGIGFFVPNLHPWRSALAGVAGGFLGAVAFIIVSKLHVAPGRMAGAALLGGCIGLMVAIVELAFRTAWLEVRYSASEVITVNLGPNPVKIGGDNSCTIWARGAPPVALLFWLRHGKVMCEDAVNRTKKEVKDGSRHRAGTLEVVVRTGEDDKAEPPVPKVERPSQTALDLDDDPLPMPPVAKPAAPPPSKTEDDFDSLPLPASPPTRRPIDEDDYDSLPIPISPASVPPPAAKPAKPPVPKPAKPPVPRGGGACPKCKAKLAPGKRSCPECGANW